MTNQQNQLVLRHDKLGERLTELFTELDADSDLQKLFIENPALVLRSKVLSEFDLSSETPASTRFIYAVLGNEGLLKWAIEYSARVVKERIDPATERRDWANALIAHMDESTRADLFGLSAASMQQWSGAEYVALRIESHYTTRTDKTSTEKDTWAVTKVSTSHRRGTVPTAEDEYLASVASRIRSIVDVIVKGHKTPAVNVTGHDTAT